MSSCTARATSKPGPQQVTIHLVFRWAGFRSTWSKVAIPGAECARKCFADVSMIFIFKVDLIFAGEAAEDENNIELSDVQLLLKFREFHFFW